MKGSELLKKLKKLGRQNGVQVKVVQRRGKDSHGTLHYGDKFTIKEI